MIWIFVLVSITCLLLFSIWKSKQDLSAYKNLPPFGPRGLPLVGNAFQLDMTGAHKTFSEWRKTYGNVFSINVFNQYLVVLNDFDSIYEMTVTKTLEFSSRKYTYRGNDVYGAGYEGVTFLGYSDQWAFRKKTMITTMKGYGEGRFALEKLATNFIDKLVENITEQSRMKPDGIDMKPLLHLCLAGIITALVYGEELSDEVLLEMLKTEESMLKLLSPTGIQPFLDIFPALRFLPIPSLRKCCLDCNDFTNCIVRLHESQKKKRQISERSCIAHELDALEDTGQLTNKEVMGMCIDTISASFTTTTLSLYSLISILITRQDIQEKMYNEIQSVFGEDRPRLEHRKKLPYTEAVILETLRYASIVPILIPHTNREDTTLAGYDIPKGTTILANLWALHRDESTWDNPDEFVPERFLTTDGELRDVHDKCRKAFMAFGRGRRACPGEQLARNRAFLVVTHLVKALKFKAVDPDNPPDLAPENYRLGVVMTPPTYEVKIEERE